MKTPTVYIATLVDRERMALCPPDERGENDERFPFPSLWRPRIRRHDGKEWPWITSCLSATAPDHLRFDYGTGKPQWGGARFNDDGDAIAWLLEQEEARRAR